MCKKCYFILRAGEDRRCPHCRNEEWGPLFIPFIHRLLDSVVHICQREVCQEIFPDRLSLESHCTQCLINHEVLDEELSFYIYCFTPAAFIKIFSYNLPLISRLADYAMIDLWWYGLELQEFLDENDFVNE